MSSSRMTLISSVPTSSSSSTCTVVFDGERVGEERRNLSTCSQCKIKLDNHRGLHVHLAMAHRDELIKCSLCDMNSKTLARRHLCPVCNEYAVNLVEHETGHYVDKTGRNAVLECPYPHCYRSFERLSTLKAHLPTHKKQLKDYRCRICGERFSNSIRHIHYANNHPKTKDNQLWQRFQLLHEQFSETSTDVLLPRECALCRRIFATRTSLYGHVQSVHSMEEIEEKFVLIEAAMVNALIGNAQDEQCPSSEQDNLGEDQNDKMIESTERQESIVFPKSSIPSSTKSQSLRQCLIDHCLIETKASNARCRVCQKTFDDMFHFELHLAAEHLQLGLFIRSSSSIVSDD